jgi:hypothetical protein
MEASALPKRSTLAVIALRSIMNVPDLFKFRIFGFLKISLILRGRLQWDALPVVFELEGCFLCFPFIRDSCNQAIGRSDRFSGERFHVFTRFFSIQHPGSVEVKRTLCNPSVAFSGVDQSGIAPV